MDFLYFWSHYWWLIFPLFWMIVVSARIWSRHSESRRILDMIRSYTDQGKDPPASLVELFKAPRGWGNGCNSYGRYSEPYFTYRLWRRFFLFALLCGVFAMTAYWHDGWPDGMGHHWHGMFIPALVFGVLALSNLMALLFRPRLPPDQKLDEKPDQK